jgi:hypothetical protein
MSPSLTRLVIWALWIIIKAQVRPGSVGMAALAWREAAQYELECQGAPPYDAARVLEP